MAKETHFFDVSSPGYLGVVNPSFSGADVSVLFSIHGSTPSFNAGSQSFTTVQLQTITMTSASSLHPVRRTGEASASTYTKGARTFAGSMVFSILGNDPLQEIFSVDAVRSAARTDRHWHIDQMPPIDCMLMFAGETGGGGMQMIQGMQISNWGEVVSIDDLYTEVTYTFIAEHITPFISSDYMAGIGTSTNKTIRAIEEILGSVQDYSKTPDDAVEAALELYNDELRDEYGDYLKLLFESIFKRYTTNNYGVPFLQSQDGGRTLAGGPPGFSNLFYPGSVSVSAPGPEVPGGFNYMNFGTTNAFNFPPQPHLNQ